MSARPRLIVRLVTIVVAALVVSAATSRVASAQTAAKDYQRAQAREQAARKSATTTPAALRAIATSYEAIVRHYPTSGYSDNALWQAAGLLQLAYDRSHVKGDRDGAVRLLQWLNREYPKSPLLKQTDERLAALTARPATQPPAAAAKAPDAPARQSAPAQAPLVSPPAVPSPPVAPAPTVAQGPARGSAVAVKAPPPAPTVPPAATPVAAIPPASSVKSSPLAPPSVADAQRKMDVSLREVTHVMLPKGERITLELTREVVYTSERAASPDQLVITLPGVATAGALVDAAAALHGSLVRAVKVVPRLDGTQLRLEFIGQPHYSMFPLYEPHRLVIDVEPDAVPAAAVTPPVRSAPLVLAVPAPRNTSTLIRTPSAGPSPSSSSPSPSSLPSPLSLPTTEETVSKPVAPASTRNGGYSLARQLGLGVSRIVIDPGHGGHDPGAQANGVSEAELVLDIAKRLQTLLADQPGFEIVLTRSTDEFIPLQERTAIANRESADLFLSIHANSSPQGATRGIETYFLNFASNPQAESVAARENASSGQGMRILPEIVKAIALNNKLAESRELAGQVQSSLTRRLSFQNSAVKDLGVKQAPFVVLIGAQMPSVLAEVAFLTNRSDAGLLKQTAYRQRIAQALCDAVLKYQASLKKVATVAARTEER